MRHGVARDDPAMELEWVREKQIPIQVLLKNEMEMTLDFAL